MNGKPNNRFIITTRREKVFVMLSQGFNETEIADALCVDPSTICRDLKTIKRLCRTTIKSIFEDVLPYEFKKSLISIQQLEKECWKIFNDNTGEWTNKNKLDALKLLNQLNMANLEILQIGPLSLRAQEIVEKVEELVEEKESAQKSFFVMQPPLDSYENMK